jgi:hypothetical protein
MRKWDHWIERAWHTSESGGVIERRSPADGSILAGFAEGTATDAAVAIKAVKVSFAAGAWSDLDISKRVATKAVVARAEVLTPTQANAGTTALCLYKQQSMLCLGRMFFSSKSQSRNGQCRTSEALAR